MRRLPLLSFFAVILAVCSLGRTARANDPATAQALFDQARKLMKEERWSEACPKLEESQRLDPGGGTLLHLALCREHEGKTATAWANYQEALAAAKRDGRKDRARIAQARIDALGPRLPRMRVRVAAGNRKVRGFELTRDDTSVGEAQWGEAFPVDPGTHSMTAKADGYKTWSSRVDIPSSPAETTIDVPELEPDGSTAPAVASTTTTTTKSTALADATRGDGERTLGLVLGGVGAAGIVVGSVFGVLSFSKHNEANDQCEPPDFSVCTPAGVSAGEDASAMGNISTIAFIAGGVFVVAGVILYFTAPEPSKKLGRLGPSASRARPLGLGFQF